MRLSLCNPEKLPPGYPHYLPIERKRKGWSTPLGFALLKAGRSTQCIRDCLFPRKISLTSGKFFISSISWLFLFSLKRGLCLYLGRAMNLERQCYPLDFLPFLLKLIQYGQSSAPRPAPIIQRESKKQEGGWEQADL